MMFIALTKRDGSRTFLNMAQAISIEWKGPRQGDPGSLGYQLHGRTDITFSFIYDEAPWVEEVTETPQQILALIASQQLTGVRCYETEKQP